MTYYQQTSNEQMPYIYNQANKPYHVSYVPVQKANDYANHSGADTQHTRSTLAPQTEPPPMNQHPLIQLQSNQLMSLPASIPLPIYVKGTASPLTQPISSVLASMSNPVISTPRYNDEAIKQMMHQNPGFHPPSDLKFQEINHHEFSDTFTNTAPSSIMGINSHYPNHQPIHTNASRNSNNSMSTKTTLNASATDFIPTGYSNKASSKCKVMETITEQKQIASRDEKPDVACPNDDKDAINRFDCKDYKQAHDVDVPSKLKGTVIVPFEFTSKYIPDKIKETLHDVYSYMDKAMAFKNNKKVFENTKGNIIVIINFGFHSKNLGLDHFCVMEQKDNSGKRKWRMKKKLFTDLGIEYGYGITRDQLPSYHTPNPDKYQIDQNVIQNTFATTKWSRIPIYAKQRTKVKQRRVLHITNQEFVKILKEKSVNNNNIIPIISVNDDVVSTENVMIINLTADASIGISYKLEPSTNILKITGIHLDKDQLLTYYQLASPESKCNCLDDFTSNIDELKIGNVYAEQNTIKSLKKQNKQFRDENKNPIMKYIKQVLHDANDVISNNLKTALLSIKHIFNLDTIKQAIENCLKTKHDHSTQSLIQPMISSDNPICDVMNRPMQYLATIDSDIATTIPLPQSAIT